MRVLLIGWDAADWKVIRPLLDSGQMPNLARLMAGGVHGNLATIYPVLSPMLWTSIATGKRPYKHGIHGFTEPLPDGSGVRPITLLSRKTKAIWNILNQTGRRSLVVGWWPSHPAEPINGVMVSNHFQDPVGSPGEMPPLSAGIVHPRSMAATLSDLRVNPMELDGDIIRLFVPDFEKVDQAADKRLHSLGKIIAETMSTHAVATELLANQPWDFAAIYYSGIDHFSHAFMRYHPPRLPSVPDLDFALYHDVVANAYRYHDGMLGALLSFTDAETTVILMSDHGFHPDHLRPGYIPAEAAGPAVEHRHFGIVCLAGPGLQVNAPLYGAGVLDICPTILALYGLAPARDMDGKVLVSAFKKPPLIEPIPSWDEVPGDAGTHSPETRLDPVPSAQAFRQLVELGYVAAPVSDARAAVEECTRELKYNLALSWRDGNCCHEAAALAEELWTRWPREHRFGILLIECLGPMRQTEQRRAAIEELARRVERYRAEAQVELASRSEFPPASSSAHELPEAPPWDPRRQRAHFDERQLQELAHGRPLLIEWFLVSQALLENRPLEARRGLEILLQGSPSSDDLNQRIAAALAELGDLQSAARLLEEILRADPENALVHSQLAAIHFEADRFDLAISAATESLSLLYFQPGLHSLLGHALVETKRFAEAEQELRVAVAQSPGHLAAHELLGRLYRQHLNRPTDAFAHEGRAFSLRNELARRRRGNGQNPAADVHGIAARSHAVGPAPAVRPFSRAINPRQVVTVVAGLPRSGTSMMMQVLAAAGLEPLTDGKRAADADNPMGYFEFEKSLGLPQDVSWLPQARGRVVKIVAQLLPFLPAGEFYNVILMERDLGEVIASQRAMLARQGRRGAELNDQQLAEAFADQFARVRKVLSQRGEVRTLFVSYEEFLADPHRGVSALSDFLGITLDRDAAISSVLPQLRRQKR